MQLKLTLAQWNQEMATLKEINATQKKDFDELTAKYETLEKMYKYVWHWDCQQTHYQVLFQHNHRSICQWIPWFEGVEW